MTRRVVTARGQYGVILHHVTVHSRSHHGASTLTHHIPEIPHHFRFALAERFVRAQAGCHALVERGDTGIVSPWPEVTDPEEVGQTRAGDTNDRIFKTWLKVSAIESLDPLLRLDAFEPVPDLSKASNLLHQFGPPAEHVIVV